MAKGPIDHERLETGIGHKQPLIPVLVKYFGTLRGTYSERVSAEASTTQGNRRVLLADHRGHLGYGDSHSILGAAQAPRK